MTNCDLTKIYEEYLTWVSDKTAATEYVIEYLQDMEFEDIRNLMLQVASARACDGSWGLVYTAELDKMMTRPEWVDAVNAFADKYLEWYCEDYIFTGTGKLIWDAIEGEARLFLMWLQDNIQPAMVTMRADTMDTKPDRVAFTSRSEAEDFYYEEIDRRVQWRVDHSQEVVSDDEREAMWEEEAQLVTIEGKVA